MKSCKDLLRSQVCRPQTPKAELLMQELIYDALNALMQESYLYRSRRMEIAPILELADNTCVAGDLRNEFERRPWVPWSQNQGSTHEERRDLEEARGCEPLGTPQEGRRLPFVIPTTKRWCYECRTITAHDSVPHIEWSPYHFNPNAVAEPLGIQNFLFNMVCQECKSPPTLFMIRREFLKVQLCGRSHPFLPQPPDEIPSNVRDVYRDAVGAAACGDLAGAFYHLRTLLEHHMKAELGITIADKLDGDELCAKYNQKVDPVLRERSSVKSTLDLCSSHLHNRTGSFEDYERALDAIRNHLLLKDTLRKLGSRR